MMRAPAVSLVLTILLFSGCAPSPTHYWYHPQKTLEQAKADYRECETRAEAWVAESDVSMADDHRRGDPITDDWEFYQEHQKHPALRASYQRSIIEGCMRGKGYLKVRDYRLPSDVRRKDYETGGVAGR